MRLVPVSEVEDHMTLGKSLYQLNGKLLLGAGFRINAEMKSLLIEKGFTHIYIHDEGTEDVIPEDIVSDEVSFHAKNQLARKIYDIQNHAEFKNTSVTKAVELISDGYLKETSIPEEMKMIVEEIIKDISTAGADLLNSVMIKTADTLFLDHALNVTVLSLLIGRKYHLPLKELRSLGLGTFLHDIGKSIIEQMDKSKNEMTPKALYYEHPIIGYTMLSNLPNISPIETQIVLQHHERQDGKGFPNRLKGKNLPPLRTVRPPEKGYIFRLAEICNVANAFDNFAYNITKKTLIGPIHAIEKIILGAGTRYNQDIVEMLVRIVPYYPVGVTIKVEDISESSLIGCIGVVAKLNKEKINRPVIILTQNKYKQRMKPVVVDTSQISSVKLSLVL